MRARAVVKAVVALAVLVAAVAWGPVLWLQLDEGAVPPSSAVPSLPSGVTVASEDVFCGSGGCWLELELVGRPDQSPAEVAASTGLSAEQSCSAQSLLDRRSVCSHLGVGDRVVLYLQYDR